MSTWYIPGSSNHYYYNKYDIINTSPHFKEVKGNVFNFSEQTIQLFVESIEIKSNSFPLKNIGQLQYSH